MSTSSDAAEFHQHIDEIRLPLDALIAGTSELRVRWGQQPAPESRAMAQIAEESGLSVDGPWGREPVMDSLQTAWLYVIVAEDHIRSLSQLLATPPAPTFSHVVVGRAALEALGRALWLSVVDLTTRQRVARMMSDRIYSTYEILELPLDDRQKVEDRRTAILEAAQSMGFKKIKGHPAPSFDESRKGNTAIVRWLLDETEAKHSVGEVLYRFYSAVAHATLDGIAQSINVNDNGSVFGGYSASMFTHSADVRNLLAAITLSYTNSCDTLIELLGWGRTKEYQEVWAAAITAAQIHEVN